MTANERLIVPGTPENPDFSGQDLFRWSLDEGSLSPFDMAAEHMERVADSDPLYAANIFKSIRFGLAGIIIHGWEQAALKELSETEQISFGRYALTHAFADTERTFRPYDATVIGGQFIGSAHSHVVDTQGEAALNELRFSFVKSMADYVSMPDHAVEGVTVGDTLDTIAGFVLQGRRLGLADVPDLARHGMFEYNDIYRARTPGSTINRYAVGVALQEMSVNLVRFTKGQWTVAARYFNDPANAEAHNTGDSFEDVIMRLHSFVLRASQRREGIYVVSDAIGAERDADTFVEPNDVGQLEVMWLSKDTPPFPTSTIDAAEETGQTAGITKRNKCPIGYTRGAGEPMPGHKLFQAICAYMVDMQVATPASYLAPRSVAASI